MTITETRAHRWMIYLLLIVGGTTGIAALFLPFTFDTSPMDVVVDAAHRAVAGGVRGLVRNDGLFFVALAGPFFLAFLVSGAASRWIISGSFSRAEKAIAYFAAAAGTYSTLWILLQWELTNPEDWLSITIPLMTLLLGGYGVIRNLRWGTHKDLSALMALEVAYLGNCVLCLVVFFGDWQLGACFALATAAVYLLHVIFVSAQRRTPELWIRGPEQLDEFVSDGTSKAKTATIG